MKTSLLLSFLLLLLGTLKAQQAEAVIAEGNRQYADGKFDKAITQYQEALKKGDASGTARYNLGAAQFRAKNLEAAEKEFNEVASAQKNTSLKHKALYNKGVALSKQKKLLESIQAYKEALKLNPTDADTRFNLQKALEEWKQQQKKEEQTKPNPQQQKNQDKPQPPANKKMMEQWLQSLRQKEQEVQQKMLNKSRAAKQPEKDW